MIGELLPQHPVATCTRRGHAGAIRRDRVYNSGRFHSSCREGWRTLRIFARVIAMVVLLIVAWPEAVPSYAQPSQKSLAATMQRIVDTIKDTCRQLHPDYEQEYRECAVKRHGEMKSFWTKLWHYRDTKGIHSDELKKGMECADNASPKMRGQGRKVDLVRADWIQANKCYEEALR